MANNPITVPLPQDLPETWAVNQIVSPDGVSAGLTPQHGYNYLMKQVNNAQQAAQELGEGIAGLSGDNLPASSDGGETISAALSNKADKGPPQVYDLPVADGYTVAVDGAGYSKTQEGIVCVYFSVNGNFEASASDIGGDAFATLPEGFRPTGKISVPVVQQDIPGPDWVKVIVHPDGSMRYYGNGSTTAIYGSVSFVASA